MMDQLAIVVLLAIRKCSGCTTAALCREAAGVLGLTKPDIRSRAQDLQEAGLATWDKQAGWQLERPTKSATATMTAAANG